MRGVRLDEGLFAKLAAFGGAARATRAVCIAALHTYATPTGLSIHEGIAAIYNTRSAHRANCIVVSGDAVMTTRPLARGEVPMMYVPNVPLQN
jgi:hypothetical protein